MDNGHTKYDLLIHAYSASISHLHLIPLALFPGSLLASIFIFRRARGRPGNEAIILCITQTTEPLAQSHKTTVVYKLSAAVLATTIILWVHNILKMLTTWRDSYERFSLVLVCTHCTQNIRICGKMLYTYWLHFHLTTTKCKHSWLLWFRMKMNTIHCRSNQAFLWRW